MKYFVIAGEASGDLHARHLMDALRQTDADADIRYWYRPELAYMGFVSVALHLGEILRGMRECREAIAGFAPDRLVLVDYPGFNLKIAAWFHDSFVARAGVDAPKVVYYIPPKIWAWKEGRIRQIRKYVDVVLSILPFEVGWYRDRHSYKVDYVGNPTLDEITVFRASLGQGDVDGWRRSLGLTEADRVVALMPGSRRQEVERNLPLMLRAAAAVGGVFKYVIAQAPSLDGGVYKRVVGHALGGDGGVLSERVVLAPCQGSRSSFMLLQCAFAALVTSGTATLETAIMGVPQVVCYSMACGRVVSLLRRALLKVPYVSLVNLIAGSEVVPELVAGDMTPSAMEENLRALLRDEVFRERQRQGYCKVMGLLGDPGAPLKAASLITGG